MTLELRARIASAVTQPDNEILMAGIAEHADGSGWSLTFQGGSPLEVDDESVNRFRDGLALIFMSTSIDSRPRRRPRPGWPGNWDRPRVVHTRPVSDRRAVAEIRRRA
jgi:hypothetical protein